MSKQKNKKRKKTFGDYLLLFIFLIGLGILSYPVISRMYYQINSTSVINDFEAGKSKLDIKEINRRIDLAKAYNYSLISGGTGYRDPYSKKQKEEGRKEYARMLEINEKMGHIKVPKINIDLPIYAGTSEKVLQKGVGHLEGTSLPVGGPDTHAVLTAHRGLPTAKLFTDLDKLQIGDTFYVYNIKEPLAYQIDSKKVIEPSEFQDLMISENHDYVTLLTCTPYMINSHRLLVRGHRIPYVKAKDKKETMEGKVRNWKKIMLIALPIIIILAIYIRKKIVNKKKHNKSEKERRGND
ncbi:class C sortase [Peptostreptococcus canis]|uniref:Class C sortase n=1 Tax=Peptostreptococcus canis TaxID=1159213 RepID=A0ABR6TMJ2_9FIRM|nr:class C sortase [Peptostreptococcus canis]MBC2576619.1 class C sortase [Peptostreptococcus canis]MBP1998806.1 sortase A [Peptostreptococcus canis]